MKRINIELELELEHISVLGGEGRDIIQMPFSDGFDKIYEVSALSGDDVINADNYAIIDAGAGNDVVIGGAFVRAGSGDDTILRSVYDRVVYTEGGNDEIYDNDGDSTVYSGAGDDYFAFDDLHGNQGSKDVVHLGTGNDHAISDYAVRDSFLDGGKGIDTLDVDGGYGVGITPDVLDFRELRGGNSMKIGGVTITNFERVNLVDTAKPHVVYFGRYDDIFSGIGRGDVVYGGGGDDYLDSGDGGDKLFGGSGNDIIIADGGGGVNRQRAWGGMGDDILYGPYMASQGRTGSSLTGGTGRDGFVDILGNFGNAQKCLIQDFQSGKDWIGIGRSYNRYDPWVSNRMALEKHNLVETKDSFSFDIKFYDYSWSDEYTTVRYDKHSGIITYEEHLFGDFLVTARSTRFVLIGAPNLRPEDIYLMTPHNGQDSNEHIYGNDADNALAGRDGADTVHGGSGDDLLYGDNPGYAFVLPGSGKPKDRLYGEGGNDTLCGGLAGDLLDGGAGLDTVTYEESSAVNINLATGAASGGEATNDILQSIEGVIGSKRGDVISGDSKDNILIGLAGRDVLFGGLGADILMGDHQDIFGSLTEPVLSVTEDLNPDVFVYSDIRESGLTVGTTDQVWGFFNGGGKLGDKIDLQNIDADGKNALGNGQFTFIGNSEFTGSVYGEVRTQKTSDFNTFIVSLNTDGDIEADMMIVVHSLYDLTAGDFIL